MSSSPRLLPILALSLVFGAGRPSQAQEDSGDPLPVRVFLESVDGDPDLLRTADLVRHGLAERCLLPIEWRIGKIGETEIRPEDFDLAIYLGGGAGESAENDRERILAAHRTGLPAMVLGRAPGRFSGEEWKAFAGAEVGVNEGEALREIVARETDHPVGSGIPAWSTMARPAAVGGTVVDSALVLAEAREPGTDTGLPVIWISRFGAGRSKIFGSVLGEESALITEPEVLDLFARGFLWAVDRLEDDLLVLSDRVADDRLPLLRLGDNVLSRAVSRSSTGEAAMAHDGDGASVWRADQGDVIPWWEALLAAPVRARAIAISWEEGNERAFTIEFSADGREWDTIVRRLPSAAAPRVFLHSFDAEVSGVRLLNPDSGRLPGIAEVALYEDLAEVPGHVRSAAFDPGEEVRRDREEPIARGQARVASSWSAYSLLKNPDASRWEAAFAALARKKGSGRTVDWLIRELEATDSGRFRSLALETIGALYRDKKGDVWSESARIERVLRDRIGARRVDQRVLLTVLLRHRVPVPDMERVVALAGSDTSLKELCLGLLETNPVPESAGGFLHGIIFSGSEDREFRLRAARLLSQFPAPGRRHEMFRFAAEIAPETEVCAMTRLFVQELIADPAWEEDGEWLLGLVPGPDPAESALAWHILLQEEPGEEDGAVAAAVAAALESGGPAAAGLVEGIRRGTFEERRETLVALLDHPEAGLQEAAAGALRRLDRLAGERKTTVEDIAFARLMDEVAQVEGDWNEGKQVYLRTCRKCHLRHAPPLVDLSGKYPDLPSLAGAILDPDRDVVKGYRTRIFHLDDGNVYRGFVGAENDEGILEVVDREANTVLIRRERVRSEKAGEQSGMPAGAAHGLTTAEFADLLAYLRGR